ncbi:MAG: polysaccharide deacetylase family protein [Pseudomonadota bacterium]
MSASQPKPTTAPSLRGLAKSVLMATGLLPAWHRRRNAHALTVLMFHRVLPRAMWESSHADGAYTVSPEFLDTVLTFAARHFTFVGLRNVLAGDDLPPCPLLVTFDDGWADNAAFAAPVLQAHDVKAVFFLSAGAFGAGAARFTPERLFAHLTVHPSSGASFGTILGQPSTADARALSEAAIFAGPEALQDLDRALDDAGAPSFPTMMSGDDLAALQRAGHSFGVHGWSHRPLTRVDDPYKELAQARDWLHGTLGEHGSAEALSFPHGQFNDATLRAASDLGYRLCFSSAPDLTPWPPGPPGASSAQGRPRPIGRIEIKQDAWLAWSDRLGRGDRVNEANLATQLFTAPFAAPL